MTENIIVIDEVVSEEVC